MAAAPSPQIDDAILTVNDIIVRFDTPDGPVTI